MNRHLKRALEVALVPLAAAIVFFEQTLIKYLNVAMAAVARWPPIAQLEAWLVRLAALRRAAGLRDAVDPDPADQAHCAVVRDNGRSTGWRSATLIVGKMLGTAVLARLYRILRPRLMTIPWFARADTWFFYWRDQAYAFVKSLPAWQRIAAMVQQLRVRIMELVSGLFAR